MSLSLKKQLLMKLKLSIIKNFYRKKRKIQNEKD